LQASNVVVDLERRVFDPDRRGKSERRRGESATEAGLKGEPTRDAFAQAFDGWTLRSRLGFDDRDLAGMAGDRRRFELEDPRVLSAESFGRHSPPWRRHVVSILGAR
jgi:hypothetical protein